MSFRDDLKKPFNIITLTMTVASVILTIVVYKISQKEGRPTYIVSEAPNKIFDSTISSPKINVRDENFDLVKENIFLVTVTFWNSGTIPIEPSDVRIPVKITISPCERILDYTIVQETKPEVSKFELSEDPDNSPNNTSKSIIIAWKHMDPNHGIKFEIYYSGKDRGKIEFGGDIAGVTKIMERGSSINVSLTRMIIPIGGIFFIPVTILLMSYFRENLFPKYLSEKTRFVVMVFGIVLIIVLLGFLVYRADVTFFKGARPPF